MEEKKDIKFNQKKVDESWKENIDKEKGGERPINQGRKKDDTGREDGRRPASVDFSNFITSLSLQVLIHLGDIENPLTKKKEKDLDAAKQTIDLIVMLKEKTKGNLTEHEDKLISAFLSDLQIKYVEVAKS